MRYYIYENWTAEHKAVIHKGTCRYCNEGQGCQENSLGNKNGKWHGPFDSFEKAGLAAENTGRPVRPCSRCI